MYRLSHLPLSPPLPCLLLGLRGESSFVLHIQTADSCSQARGYQVCLRQEGNVWALFAFNQLFIKGFLFCFVFAFT